MIKGMSKTGVHHSLCELSKFTHPKMPGVDSMPEAESLPQILVAPQIMLHLNLSCFSLRHAQVNVNNEFAMMAASITKQWKRVQQHYPQS